MKKAHMLTSNSTRGKPKGVILSHYNVIANIWQWRSLQPKISKLGKPEAAIFPFYHAAGLIALQVCLCL